MLCRRIVALGGDKRVVLVVVVLRGDRFCFGEEFGGGVWGRSFWRWGGMLGIWFGRGCFR